MNKLPTYFRYWGKAEEDGERFHLLPYHCLDVAAVGHSLLVKNTSLRRKFGAITGLDDATCRRWPELLLKEAIKALEEMERVFNNLRFEPE